MAVDSGLYGLNLQRFFEDTYGGSISSTTMYCGMVTDSHTPAFDTDDDYGTDIDNEVPGTGNYTTGGQALPATPSITVASPAAGQLEYSSAAVTWSTATISNAEAAFLYYNDANDYLLLMSDFGAPASSTAGDFTVTPHANGWFYLDYIP
jgi:hypothetical protein